MDAIFAVVSKLGAPRYEEDKVDWANFQLTAYIFAISSVLITSYTYMGSAIKCWTPAEFRGGWVEYARDFCLIENTYYVAIDDPDMPDQKYREQKEIPYYQWVPFVLVILAFLWYIPHLFWRSFNWWSGIQVRAIVMASSTLPVDEEERSKSLDKISGHIQRSAFDYNAAHAPYKLTIFYLIMKGLFLLNIVLQVIILHIFLGFDWSDLLRLKLGFNTDWKATGLFPRTTMCDFTIRNKGNLQSYSIQCVLAQNMFNEKIFLVLFYWILFLFVVTIFNTFTWMKQIFLKVDRSNYARRMLESAGVGQPKKTDYETAGGYNQALSDYEDFVALSGDSVVLLRLIASNAGDSVTSQLLKRLYDKTVDKKE